MALRKWSSFLLLLLFFASLLLLGTALHIACSDAQLDVARLLVDAGSSIKARDRWGNSSLDDAERDNPEGILANFLRDALRRQEDESAFAEHGYVSLTESALRNRPQERTSVFRSMSNNTMSSHGGYGGSVSSPLGGPGGGGAGRDEDSDIRSDAASRDDRSLSTVPGGGGSGADDHFAAGAGAIQDPKRVSYHDDHHHHHHHHHSHNSSGGPAQRFNRANGQLSPTLRSSTSSPAMGGGGGGAGGSSGRLPGSAEPTSGGGRRRRTSWRSHSNTPGGGGGGGGSHSGGSSSSSSSSSKRPPSALRHKYTKSPGLAAVVESAMPSLSPKGRVPENLLSSSRANYNTAANGNNGTNGTIADHGAASMNGSSPSARQIRFGHGSGSAAGAFDAAMLGARSRTRSMSDNEWSSMDAAVAAAAVPGKEEDEGDEEDEPNNIVSAGGEGDDPEHMSNMRPPAPEPPGPQGGLLAGTPLQAAKRASDPASGDAGKPLTPMQERLRQQMGLTVRQVSQLLGAGNL